MLPLWIIDLTQDADRRKTFTDLLGRVKGVLTDNENVLNGTDTKETQFIPAKIFLDKYEKKEDARECIWYYSHIENPFNDKEVLNAPYRPSEQDEAGTIALSGLAQGIGFIGGGLLAWLAGLSLQFPAPDMWIAGLYTCFTFTGLFFGLSAANASPRTNA